MNRYYSALCALCGAHHAQAFYAETPQDFPAISGLRKSAPRGLRLRYLGWRLMIIRRWTDAARWYVVRRLWWGE